MVLDYIIRNTDRGNDNWLIKLTSVSLTFSYFLKLYNHPLFLFS